MQAVYRNGGQVSAAPPPGARFDTHWNLITKNARKFSAAEARSLRIACHTSLIGADASCCPLNQDDKKASPPESADRRTRELSPSTFTGTDQHVVTGTHRPCPDPVQ